MFPKRTLGLQLTIHSVLINAFDVSRLPYHVRVDNVFILSYCKGRMLTMQDCQRIKIG